MAPRTDKSSQTNLRLQRNHITAPLRAPSSLKLPSNPNASRKPLVTTGMTSLQNTARLARMGKFGERQADSAWSPRPAS
jgi:hypothetical protein